MPFQFTPVVSPKKKDPPKRKAIPPKTFLNPIQEKNEFLTWISTLNIAEYPCQQAVLRRIQTYKRPGLIEDVAELFQLFTSRQKSPKTTEIVLDNEEHTESHA